MPRIVISVGEVQKELWVVAAHEERVSLSEWIRRRCDDGLEAGAAGDAGTDGGLSAKAQPRAAGAPASSPRLPQSVREFRPDPKKKP